MSSLPVITIIGSLNIDLVSTVHRVPTGGETLSAQSFAIGSGGKGANQAVACAKLSRSSTSISNSNVIIKMCGAVGDDAYGSVMVSELQKYGIDTTGISVEEDTKTGVAVIIVEAATGENRIILSAEANHSVQPERFMELEIPLPDLLIIQLEIPLPTVLQILKVAKKQGVEVLLNAVPAIQLPNEVYGMVTHLVVNESEAIILSGCKDEDLERVEGLENVAKKFRKLGVKNVIITLGEKGVFYSGPGGEGMEKALDVKVVDTTAAGDTFVGAYALEAVKVDFDIKGAIKNATKAAAKTVERKGAQYSIPWSNEL